MANISVPPLLFYLVQQWLRTREANLKSHSIHFKQKSTKDTTFLDPARTIAVLIHFTIFGLCVVLIEINGSFVNLNGSRIMPILYLYFSGEIHYDSYRLLCLENCCCSVSQFDSIIYPLRFYFSSALDTPSKAHGHLLN